MPFCGFWLWLAVGRKVVTTIIEGNNDEQYFEQIMRNRESGSKNAEDELHSLQNVACMFMLTGRVQHEKPCTILT